MRGLREGDDAGPVREQGLQIVGMERPVLAHPPPLELRADLLELEPGRDVGVVVHVGDDDLVPLAERLADREAHHADERRRVHAEADFRRVRGVDQDRDALARVRDRLIDQPALVVAPAALDIVVEKMVVDRVEHALRDLRAGGVVEEDEGAGAVGLQRGELRAQRLDRKCRRFARFRFGRRHSPWAHRWRSWPVSGSGCRRFLRPGGEISSLK